MTLNEFAIAAFVVLIVACAVVGLVLGLKWSVEFLGLLKATVLAPFFLSLVGLFVGTMVIAVVEQLIAGREKVNLHVGTAILVAALGSLLFLLWGWWSTLGILAILTIWTLIGSFLDRFDRR